MSDNETATLESATLESGNTKGGLKKRDWFVTINEKSLENYNEIRSYFENRKSCTYVLCVEHIGGENKHYHLFAQFKTPSTLSLKKLFGSHVEAIRGTPQETVDYMMCRDIKHISKGIKAVVVDEWGTIRESGGMRVGDLKKMTSEELDELPSIYFNIAKKLQEEKNNDIDLDNVHKNVKVYYIWGPSGVGKSRKAIEMIKENGFKSVNMVKYENGFYHGVGTVKQCIYDDFRDSHMSASEFINFIDYNKHFMNIKGGSKLNEYEFIIITSVQDPNTIYKNMSDEPRKQWLRRIKIINMNEPDHFNDIQI